MGYGQHCCKSCNKEKLLLKLLSNVPFWDLYATQDQMKIPLDKLPCETQLHKGVEPIFRVTKC